MIGQIIIMNYGVISMLLLTLKYQAPIRTLADWGWGLCEPSTSISAPIAYRDIKKSGGSCAFFEKITFSSHRGQTAPQSLNIKTAVERPILKL